ncbi:MAG: transcriptional repressor [Thiobacillus sp.]|nr:transcriptional repressor [Thiobacillus sp.]
MPINLATRPRPAKSPRETPAEVLLNGVGERPTAARLAVLGILLATSTALTHTDIAAAAREAGVGMDRVTLYRVLDWLVERGLAHRIAGEDRVWRFNALAADKHGHAGAHEHAHFQCSRCGRLYCLDDLRPVFAFTLPPGFRCDHAELTLRGLCPDCGI